MTTPARFKGVPVSDGVAAGRLHLGDLETVATATPDEVRAAFAAVSGDHRDLAERLRSAGRAEEAGIVEIGALIAADPALADAAVAAVRGGSDAATAVTQAAAAQAAVLAALPVPELAERAGDVRQVARAVLEHLAGTAAAAPRPEGEFILVRRDVSAVDLIEFAEAGLTGAVSVAGGASSHAAIIARGLGVPMLTGADVAVLSAAAGQQAILDAHSGELIVGPCPGELAAVTAGARRGVQPEGPLPPARTTDGSEITVLCNVASVAETRRGLAAGAAGIGLLRTEIPFTDALGWPAQAEHEAQLAPILGLLAGRPATVRLLDFSGDKIPPFLLGAGSGPAGPEQRDPAAPARTTPGQPPGLTALLDHPTALADQLRAVLTAGRGTELAVLVPMVSSLAQVRKVRDVLARSAAALGTPVPRLGIMVELAATAAAAETFAAEVDFFSIGTNDLTGDVLRLDRRDLAAGPALAAEPGVLAFIEHVVAAAGDAGITVSVCGDAAADPAVLPLLVGLGVRTLSVPAARVPRVRQWISGLDTAACAVLAGDALKAPDVDEVWELVRRARIS